jgi:integrase
VCCSTSSRPSERAPRQHGSFRELCEEWYRSEIIGRGIKHPSVPRRHRDRYLLPKLGRTAADVTAADVARVIDEIQGRAPTAANDRARFARRIFAFGVRRRIVPANPASGFSPRLDGGGTERPRSRALSPDELAQLIEKVRETPTFGAANALALELPLALCVRTSELLGARWEESLISTAARREARSGIFPRPVPREPPPSTFRSCPR